MTIGNHEYNIPNRLKINEFMCMIPDTHKNFKDFKLISYIINLP